MSTVVSSSTVPIPKRKRATKPKAVTQANPTSAADADTSASTILAAPDTVKPSSSVVAPAPAASSSRDSVPTGSTSPTKRAIREADVIAFHLKQTSTPVASPRPGLQSESASAVSPSTSKKPRASGKKSTISKVKNGTSRSNVPSPLAHLSYQHRRIISRIALRCGSPVTVPSKAHTPSKRKSLGISTSNMVDSSSLPVSSSPGPSSPPVEVMAASQPAASTLAGEAAASQSEKPKRGRTKKPKSPEKPLQLGRQRGQSISSEGQSSDIIPPIEDDDEGYDQLLSSSQPHRPSSPLNQMTIASLNEETPTAGKKPKRQSGTVREMVESTPTGGKKGRKRKAADEDEANVEELPETAERNVEATPQTAEKAREKRKSKAAAAAEVPANPELLELPIVSAAVEPSGAEKSEDVLKATKPKKQRRKAVPSGNDTGGAETAGQMDDPVEPAVQSEMTETPKGKSIQEKKPRSTKRAKVVAAEAEAAKEAEAAASESQPEPGIEQPGIENGMAVEEADETSTPKSKAAKATKRGRKTAKEKDDPDGAIGADANEAPSMMPAETPTVAVKEKIKGAKKGRRSLREDQAQADATTNSAEINGSMEEREKAVEVSTTKGKGKVKEKKGKLDEDKGEEKKKGRKRKSEV